MGAATYRKDSSGLGKKSCHRLYPDAGQPHQVPLGSHLSTVWLTGSTAAFSVLSTYGMNSSHPQVPWDSCHCETPCLHSICLEQAAACHHPCLTPALSHGSFPHTNTTSSIAVTSLPYWEHLSVCFILRLEFNDLQGSACFSSLISNMLGPFPMHPELTVSSFGHYPFNHVFLLLQVPWLLLPLN